MTDLFVTIDELKAQWPDHKIKFVDGSWLLEPGHDGYQDYLNGHLPGAVFFDLEKIADQKTDLPHMLPSPDQFTDQIGKLGISHTDHIIVYEKGPLFSAPRVRWTFKVMGAQHVSILKGGFMAWQEAGLPVEQGSVSPVSAIFESADPQENVRTLDQVRSALNRKDTVILDARPAGRFQGKDPEPRNGLKSGHMPGAKNWPASSLIQHGQLLPDTELQDRLDQMRVTRDNHIITSCGSGVTAAILSLALEKLGYDNVSLYDGSWAEWGGRSDVPIIKDEV